MASGTVGSMHRLFAEGTLAGLSEGQLLERFLLRRDETAFAALVDRHGPMVLAVCRRVLRHEQSAEDAFQATFLLLVRRAGSIRGKDALGPWLHRVAYRVAVRAGRADSRRSSKETPSTDVVELAVSPDRPSPDLRMTIHEALNSLPEKYRAPVVLCDLQGWSHDEAARSLHWPVGSVKGRLFRAREILRTRLARQGVTATSAVIAAGLCSDAIASIPSPLHQKTVEAATAIAAGKAVAAGLVSASATALVEEAVRVMFWNKMKILAATALTLGIMTGGAGVMARQQAGQPLQATTPKADPPKTDLEKLQGDWTRVSVTRDGYIIDGKIDEKLAIRGGTLYHFDPAKKLIRPQALQVVSNTSPPQLRTTMLDGAEKGNVLGKIYRLEGDLLTICCSTKDAKVAPTEFGSTDSRVLFVYRRDNFPPPAAIPATDDLEKMQGTWYRVSSTFRGTEKAAGPNSRNARTKLTVKGNVFEFDSLAAGLAGGPIVATIDASKTPREIDLAPKDGVPPGEGTNLGIYQLDDDKLTLRRAPAKLPRPTGFETRQEDMSSIEVYQRKMPADEPAAKAEKTDLDKLQGQWECIKVTRQAADQKADPSDPLYSIIIRDQSLFTTNREGLPSSPRTLRLNGDVTPHQFEWIRKSAAGETETTRGIYRIEDGNWIIGYDLSTPTRPPENFSTGPVDGRVVRAYRREPLAPDQTAEEKAALQKLQGGWELIKTEQDGEEESRVPNIQFSVAGNRCRGYLVAGTDGLIRLDLSATPPVLQLRPTPADGSSVTRMNYKFADENTLVTCIEKAKWEFAPGELVTRPGDGRLLSIYRRRKPGLADLWEAEFQQKPKGMPAKVMPAPAASNLPTAVAAKPIAAPQPPTGDARDEPMEKLGSERDKQAAEADVQELRLEMEKKLIRGLSEAIGEHENAELTRKPPMMSREQLDESKLRLMKLMDAYEQGRRGVSMKKRSIARLDREIDAIANAGPPVKARTGKPGTIQPGDVVLIEVLEALPGRPIAGERIVRPDGTISLGFYGDLSVANLNRKEAKGMLVVHLRKYLNDEVLGIECVDEKTGKKTTMAPEDSDKVMLDDSGRFFNATPVRANPLESKLDRLQAEIRKLEESMKREEKP